MQCLLLGYSFRCRDIERYVRGLQIKRVVVLYIVGTQQRTLATLIGSRSKRQKIRSERQH
jgi:hypothetical protein